MEFFRSFDVGGRGTIRNARTITIALSALTLSLAASSPARAQTTISNPNFSVGIGAHGELFHPDPDGIGGPGIALGFRRLSDGYDPIRPFLPRDSWGLSSSAGVAYSDPQLFGVSGFVVPPPTVVSGPGSASYMMLTTFGLSVKMDFSFAADNVLRIDTTVTNMSLSTITGVAFQRNVDWDIRPTLRNENSFANDQTDFGILDVTYGGFENPNPAVPYLLSCLTGCNTVGDHGGGIKVDLGNIDPLSFSKVTYYYGISKLGETVVDLFDDAVAAGAEHGILTQSSEHGSFVGSVDDDVLDADPSTLGANSAFIAVSDIYQNVPSPTLASGLPGLLVTAGAFLFARRRRAERCASVALTG